MFRSEKGVVQRYVNRLSNLGILNHIFQLSVFSISILFKLLELAVHLVDESDGVFGIYSEFVVDIGNLIVGFIAFLAMLEL